MSFGDPLEFATEAMHYNRRCDVFLLLLLLLFIPARESNRKYLWRSTPPRFSRSDPQRWSEELIHAVAIFAEAVRAPGGGWALLWCAGKGAVNSSAAALEPEQNTGSISLKFGSEVWRDLEGVGKTDLASGIHLLHEHQFGLFQRGLLPAPITGMRPRAAS
jgi:hypothetical protein